MMTRNSTNPSTWDCAQSVPPELVERLVEYVADQGGSYLTIGDALISVADVMKHKKIVDRYALDARIQLAL